MSPQVPWLSKQRFLIMQRERGVLEAHDHSRHQPPSASMRRPTPTPIAHVPRALRQRLGPGLMAEAAEPWVAAAGGSPSPPVASGTEMWGAFEVPTTQVEAPPSAPERKSFVFTQRRTFLRTLVFPLKQTFAKLFSRGSRTSCSPSP